MVARAAAPREAAGQRRRRWIEGDDASGDENDYETEEDAGKTSTSSETFPDFK